MRKKIRKQKRIQIFSFLCSTSKHRNFSPELIFVSVHSGKAQLWRSQKIFSSLFFIFHCYCFGTMEYGPFFAAANFN